MISLFKLKKDYKIKTKIYLVFLLAIFFVAVATLFLFSGVQGPYLTLTLRSIPLLDQIRKVVQFDSLTQSFRYNQILRSEAARSYIITLEPEYEQRYQEADGRIQEIVATVLDGSTDTDRTFFSDITQALSSLAQLEQTAISYTNQGRQDEALIILESNNYVQLRNTLNQLLDRYMVEYSDTLGNQLKLVEFYNEKTIHLWSNLRTLLFLTLIFIPLLFIMILIFFSRFIVHPLKLLQRGVQNIIGGNFEHQIPIVSHDEIGYLASNFNEMAQKLQIKQQEIEQEIRQKTASLMLESEAIDEKNKELAVNERVLVSILDDLDKEKRLLDEQKLQNEVIIQNIGDGLLITDDQGTIILVNKQAENLLQMTSNELTGKKPWDVIKTYNDKNVESFTFEELFKSDISTTTTTTTTTLALSHGQHITIKVTATSFRISENTKGVIFALNDMSQEHEVDQAKTEFVSLISHQLRTPISAINWYAESVLHEEVGMLNEKQREYLNAIYKSNLRMVELVDSLLNVVRVEIGRLRINPVMVKMIDLIKTILDSLALQIKTKNLNILQNIDLTVAMYADFKLLHIVFRNIILNAINYTPSGGTVSISLQRQDNTVLLTVKDTGCGISPKDQDKIFKKLFRADNARLIETDGTGLGLYVAKSILDMVDGKIWFESIENEGTTFYVSLPIRGMQQQSGEVELKG